MRIAMALMLAVVGEGLSMGPPPNLPAQLRASDGPHTFTHDTVLRRLPAIVRSTARANPAFAPPLVAALEALALEIAAGAALTPLADAAWNAHAPMAASLAAAEGWHTAPWFLVENYLYKRILQLCAEHGAAAADPFAAQKGEALGACDEALRDTILPLFGTARAPRADPAAPLPASAPLVHFVYRSLWGNRADLSISAGDGASATRGAAAAASAAQAAAGAGVGGAGAGVGGAGAGGAGAAVPLESVRDGERLLCDDSEAVLRLLPQGGDGTVRLLLDNAGLELLTDLALAVALLELGHCATVELQVKDAPTFVSDATDADVHTTLDWLAAHKEPGARALAASAARLRASGALRVVGGDDPFLTSPCAFWEMGETRAASWAAARLVVLKGDANYRRLVGDAHWAHDTPPRAVLGAGWPAGARVLCLRTCKSEVLVGVTPAETARAAGRSAAWLTAGEFGLVQLFEAGTPAA